MLFQELISAFHQEAIIRKLQDRASVLEVKANDKEVRVKVKAETPDEEVDRIYKICKPWPVHIEYFKDKE